MPSSNYQGLRIAVRMTVVLGGGAFLVSSAIAVGMWRTGAPVVAALVHAMGLVAFLVYLAKANTYWKAVYAVSLGPEGMLFLTALSGSTQIPLARLRSISSPSAALQFAALRWDTGQARLALSSEDMRVLTEALRAHAPWVVVQSFGGGPVT